MIKKALATAAIVLSCMLAGGAYASAPPDDISIFVPESLTSVSSDNKSLTGSRRGTSVAVLSTTGKKLSVVGKVEGGGRVEVEIVNNGRSHVTARVYDGYFHAQTMLALGVNLLDVRWRKNDGPWGSKTLSIFRSSKLENGISSGYPPYIFHKGNNEDTCQACHQMKLTKAEMETGMEKSCLKCHKGLTDNLFVHGPVAVGICTVCHDPDSTPNKYRVEENDKTLCYGCHADRKSTDDSKRLLHGPVGAGMCTICHDPHSSPFEYQLIKAKSEICVMCHKDDADRWLGQNSLHPPFKSGNCTGCHDPHSSDFTYNLKVNRADICKLCHQLPIPGHLHEVGKTPQFTTPPDFPLDPEGKVMCLTCHDPHGAPGPHLTRRDGCDGCHPK